MVARGAYILLTQVRERPCWPQSWCTYTVTGKGKAMLTLVLMHWHRCGNDLVDLCLDALTQSQVREWPCWPLSWCTCTVTGKGMALLASVLVHLHSHRFGNGLVGLCLGALTQSQVRERPCWPMSWCTDTGVGKARLTHVLMHWHRCGKGQVDPCLDVLTRVGKARLNPVLMHLCRCGKGQVDPCLDVLTQLWERPGWPLSWCTWCVWERPS